MNKLVERFGAVVIAPMVLVVSLSPFILVYLWNFQDGERLLGDLYERLIDSATTPVFGLVILLFTPMAIVKLTRAAGALGLLASAAFFCFHLIIWSALITAHYFGGFWVFIGFMSTVVGLIPLAIVAALVHGEWAIFGAILLQIAIVVVLFVGGAAAWEKRRRQKEGGSPAVPSVADQLRAIRPLPSDETALTLAPADVADSPALRTVASIRAIWPGTPDAAFDDSTQRALRDAANKKSE